MIKFPDTTVVNRIVPKTAFYKHLEVNTKMKNHFVNDVDRIVWAYKFAPSTLNVSDGKNVHEITVFSVVLKRKDCPSDVFIFIDKNLPRHTVFLLSCDECLSVLINYKEANQGNASMPFKVSGTYQMPWLKSEDVDLPFSGSNLDVIYENFVRYIAGELVAKTGNSLKEDIEISLQQEKLRKEIEALKSKLNSENQPQKKFLLHKQLCELKNKLIYHGN